MIICIHSIQAIKEQQQCSLPEKTLSSCTHIWLYTSCKVLRTHAVRRGFTLGKPLHSYTNPLEHYTFSVLPHSPHTASHTPQHLAQHQWDSEMHGPEQQHNNLSSIFSLLTTTQPQTSSVSLLLLLFVEDYSTYVHWLIFREASMCVFMHVCLHVHVCGKLLSLCVCVCRCVYMHC